MASREIRIAIDGATGRLCRSQHLARALIALRDEGGVALPNGDRVVPVPILLGRNPDKLAALAATNGHAEWSTDTPACLDDPSVEICFDAAATAGRAERARRAIAAGKHIYLEKPIASSAEDALDLARRAAASGLKHGTVQDKLHLPGLRKLAGLAQSGFFGEILSVRLDFGWWVFDGEEAPAQRPSWNYRKAQGGGLVLDMFPHWRYILEHLVSPIRSVSCLTRTCIPRRVDESGASYEVDVEDEAFATFELEGGIVAQIDSSWTSRVKRDELLRIKIDGKRGSAIAGLHTCFIQPAAATPKPVWNVDRPEAEAFDAHWLELPDLEAPRNGYREGWEMFLRHVAADTPFASTLLEGAKGLQLVDACYRSARERRWVDLPELSL